MVTLKLKDVVLKSELWKKIFSRTYPSTTTFKLVTLLGELNRIAKNYDTARDVLYKRYGAEQWIKDGEVVDGETAGAEKFLVVTAENETEFMQEHESLLNSEVTVDFEPVSASDLGDKHELTPAEMYQIKEFLRT